MQQAPQQPGSSQGSSKVIVIVAIVVGALFAAVAVVGVLAALAISGVRKYLENAKAAEGRATVAAIARGVIACAETERLDTLDEGVSEGLPVSTAAVPRSLDDVAGRKYMSAPSDWSSPGWDCIKFEMRDPQYFQYQWLRESSTEGMVRAIADLDGDHTPDVTFELPVTCTTSPTLACEPGTLRELR